LADAALALLTALQAAGFVLVAMLTADEVLMKLS
jgi:hypothetical protein